MIDFNTARPQSYWWPDPPPEAHFDRFGTKQHFEPGDGAGFNGTRSGDQSTQALPKLPWLDMSNWDHEPVPDREWAIRDRVPLRQVGLFSGEGGTGKSIIELMKNVAHVAGKDWFGSLPEQGPAFYLGAEDDEKELHVRLAVIARHYGVTFESLVRDGLHVLPLGEDAVMCAVNPKSGRLETTALYHHILEAAGDIKPRNISLDALSLFFAGNEINRVEVYAFAMYMRTIARAANGSVTVLSHPSLAGMASGSGLSGSTAWQGAFRFRQYLKSAGENGKDDDGSQPDADLRELEFKKNQYGPRGQNITLRYQNGLFLPVRAPSGPEQAARNAVADALFLQLLDRSTAKGENLSASRTANNYAPTVFAKLKEATRFSRDELADALDRLIDAGKIAVEPYGFASRGRTRIVRKGTP